MNQLKNIKESIRDLVKETLEFDQGLDIYQIVLVNPETYTVNIKQLNGYKTYVNVDFTGHNFGNGKGCLQLPNVDDLVLVAFVKGSEKPLVLGSLFNKFMREPDSIVQIKENEWFVNNKINGAFIFIDENNNVTIKNPIGNDVKLNQDGSFIIKNKDGYGIKVDASGNMTLSGITINHTQTPFS